MLRLRLPRFKVIHITASQSLYITVIHSLHSIQSIRVIFLRLLIFLIKKTRVRIEVDSEFMMFAFTRNVTVFWVNIRVFVCSFLKGLCWFWTDKSWFFFALGFKCLFSYFLFEFNEWCQSSFLRFWFTMWNLCQYFIILCGAMYASQLYLWCVEWKVVCEKQTFVGSSIFGGTEVVNRIPDYFLFKLSNLLKVLGRAWYEININQWGVSYVSH